MRGVELIHTGWFCELAYVWRINVHVNHEISCARLRLSISTARRNG